MYLKDVPIFTFMDYESTNPKKAVLYAANNGDLRRLSNKFFKYMDVKDSQGRNPVLISAAKGYLSRLPIDGIKLEQFLEKDIHGQNALHIASRFGQFHHLPKEILTDENLSQVDKSGNSVYDYVREFGQLDQLPDGLRAKASLPKAKQYEEVLSPVMGDKEELKNVISNFYNSPVVLGSLREFVKSSDSKGSRGNVLFGLSTDSGYGDSIVKPMGNDILNFSVKSKDEELGMIDLGNYKKDDVLSVIKDISRTTPIKVMRNYDDSPNVCMR
jgi:hypothetical protein